MKEYQRRLLIQIFRVDYEREHVDAFALELVDLHVYCLCLFAGQAGQLERLHVQGVEIVVANDQTIIHIMSCRLRTLTH